MIVEEIKNQSVSDFNEICTAFNIVNVEGRAVWVNVSDDDAIAFV
jgi:hypothetical protein